METTFNCNQDDLNAGDGLGLVVPLKNGATYTGFGSSDPNTVQVTYPDEPMIQIQKQEDGSFNIAIDGLDTAAVRRIMGKIADVKDDGLPPGVIIGNGWNPPLPEGG